MKLHVNPKVSKAGFSHPHCGRVAALLLPADTGQLS